MKLINERLRVNENKETLSFYIELITSLEGILDNELYLRDVPYSMQEGDMEVDPDSKSDAAEAIVMYLVKQNLLK